jgi:hypothetical protein
MKNTSADIRERIAKLEATIATLEVKARELYSASENAEAERSSHAFAALVEGNKDRQGQMARLAGRPQALQDEARDVERALAVAIKKILDLRARFASAVRAEKIQEVRSLCEQARVPQDQLQKLAAPLVELVSKISEAEARLSVAIRQLGQILKPPKLRKAFNDAPAIESQADLGSPAAIFAAHFLGTGGVLDGMEIGARDPSMLLYYTGKLDVIERELDKLQPQTSKDAAA